MSEKLRVSFNSPQCGWMSFELRAGEQSLTDAVSYTPYDSLADLINTLIKLLSDDTELRVRWAHNPDELDFKFSARGDEARLEVEWYRDHLRAEGTGERMFSYAGSRLDVCHPFWKALCDLQADVEVDEFARNWRREFPERELQWLSEGIRAAKRKQSHEA
jgi:hypothetical protein